MYKSEWTKTDWRLEVVKHPEGYRVMKRNWQGYCHIGPVAYETEEKAIVAIKAILGDS